MRILFIGSNGAGSGKQHMKTLAECLKNDGHYVEMVSGENTPFIPIHGLKTMSYIITLSLKTLFKRNFDIVHYHTTFGSIAIRLVSGKKVVSIHTLFSAGFMLKTPLGRLAPWFGRNAMIQSDAVTVVSPNAYRYYKKILDEIPSANASIHYIPNAIDIAGFDGTDRRYEKQIIFVGRLSPEKGTANLIAIAKRLPPNIDLIILGSGPEEYMVRDLAKSHKNVHYLGYLEKKHVVPLVRGSDILIQPSLFDETSSSILEAMSCGTTVIASNIGGTRDLITDGQDGILLDPEDQEGFVSSIMLLLDDERKRSRIAGAAIERVKDYGWDVVYRRYIELYESLL